MPHLAYFLSPLGFLVCILEQFGSEVALNAIFT